MAGMARLLHALKQVRWIILKSDGPEFIVPDGPNGFTFMPVSPTICLVGSAQTDRASIEVVAHLNRLALDCCDKYWFARDFSRCPVIRRTLPILLAPEPPYVFGRSRRALL